MAGPIRIAILANGSQAKREITGVQGTLGKLGKATKALGGVGLGLGLAGFAKSAVDVEKQFSTTMRMIQASTQASADEMAKLDALAIKLGADTSFSAGEAADAMLELAKAGLDTKTIMGGALSGTLTLAAAGGTELATASTIAANAMATFNLAGQDMDKIAAALAGGANASTASIESLGQALQQVGPGAVNAGLDINETVAALAAFDSAGVKGSDAGTSLKTMLTRLIPSTSKAAKEMQRLGLNFVDAEGNFRSLTNISEQLNRALADKSEAERTAALSTIFGSDATRAATILMKNGAKGIRQFIKATKDQSAAQEMANARMGGTEGAMERLGGSIETLKLQLGKELAPAVVAGADFIGDRLVPALEDGIAAGKRIAKALAPAAEEIAEALGHLGGEGEGAARVFDKVLIPALETTAKAVAGLVDFVDNLPRPVKEIGVQAGLAALILPRLTSALFAVRGSATAAGASLLTFGQRLAQNRAAMSYQTTMIGKLREGLHGFGGAARNVAGIGGMVALTQGMQQSNGAAKTLLTTLGGAATGFAVGGPIGAAVGGLGGLMLGLSSSTDRANTSAIQSRTSWEDYASTLDDVTGATTRATKAMIIQDLQASGALDDARRLGIEQSTLVNGILGRKKAQDDLNFALSTEQASVDALVQKWREVGDAKGFGSDQAKRLEDEISSRQDLINSLKTEVGEVENATKKHRERLLLLANTPTDVITKVQTPGAVDSAKELARLAAQYDLTPKQIQTIIKLNGIDATRKQVQGLSKDFEKVGKAKPSNEWANDLIGDLFGTRRNTKKGVDDLNELLGGAGDVKPNIAKGPFGRGVSGDLTALLGTARAGGTRIGDALGSGMYGGLGKWISPIAARSAGMVSAAIKSAQTAGQIQSPSKKTRKVGEQLGEGLEVGLRKSRPKAKTAGRKLMQSVLAGVVQGGRGVESAIASVTKAVQKSITGKKQAAREKAYLKTLRDEFKALRANGKAQDALVSGDYTRRLSKTSKLYKAMTKAGVKNLQDARAHLRGLREELDAYRATIRDTVKATGDVTGLGRMDDGTVAISTLLRDLETKTLNAERFEVLLRQLAGQGLKKAAIQQMLDAGPEAALATAEAIAFGGKAAIDEINRLQGRLAASGDRLALNMGDRYYGAGVNAAKGIVKGLEAEAKRLDKAAVRLANSLVKAVKKALGIKSPSRVFAGIGDNVVKGLDIGLDDTYVRRSGATMSAALVKGFGDPALEAYTRSASAGGEGRTIHIRLTADQVDRLTRGRELQADLDYARSNGVRGVTF